MLALADKKNVNEYKATVNEYLSISIFIVQYIYDDKSCEKWK